MTYFPYLFDKQSELLALRGLAGGLGMPQRIVPLIEPVSKADGLERLFDKFKKSGNHAYVIENPDLLVLASSAARATWIAKVAPLFADKDVFRPTLKLNSAITLGEIAAFASRHPNREIGVVVMSGHLAASAIVTALGSSDYILFLTASADRAGIVSAARARSTVEINDRFPSQRINAEYSGTEWFTRDHLDYVTNGHAGFSDYTILPPRPNQQGGGAPGAVAIHLIYARADKSFWVQHYVSDETDRDLGSAASKLLEAIAYLDADIVASPTKFDRSPAIGEYQAILASARSTNLGTNKRLEIAHHLYTVRQIL